MRTQMWNAAALVAGVVALAAGGPWLLGHLRSLPPPQTLAARSGERIVTLEVGGMTCAGCASRVHGGLVAVRGVSAVEVRYEQERAYVVCAPEVADSALVAAVKGVGHGFLAGVVRK